MFQTHEERQKAISRLFICGLLSSKEFRRLEKKSEKMEAKLRKEIRQDEVNDEVEKHLETLEPGKLFKHREVWEAVGVESFTRSEVLAALQIHRENFLVEQVRKGDNNFQVFWTRVLNDEVEV
jgi:hypothetical protein